jgi:hypothetical protein
VHDGRHWCGRVLSNVATVRALWIDLILLTARNRRPNALGLEAAALLNPAVSWHRPRLAKKRIPMRQRLRNQRLLNICSLIDVTAAGSWIDDFENLLPDFGPARKIMSDGIASVLCRKNCAALCRKK